MADFFDKHLKAVGKAAADAHKALNKAIGTSQDLTYAGKQGSKAAARDDAGLETFHDTVMDISEWQYQQLRHIKSVMVDLALMSEDVRKGKIDPHMAAVTLYSEIE